MMLHLPSPFKETTESIDSNIDRIKSELSNLQHWTERYKMLFKFAEQYPRLDEAYRLEQYLVEGCESQVWLLHYYDNESGCHYYCLDSDSKIIRGLLYIILLFCNAKSSDSIKALDFGAELNQLNFGKYMTASRSNGLMGVVKKIQELRNFER